MPSARDASGVPERFSLAACRQRWLEFLDLEHPVLPRAVGFELEGEHLLVRRQRVGGRPIGRGRIPRPARAPLLLQAAAASAFFGSRGFSLAAGDFEEALWDLAAGTPRLWLARTPRAVAGRADAPASEAVRTAVGILFGEGGRLAGAAARSLAQQLAADGAALRRGEHWVACVLRSFPELSAPGAAAARERCAGSGTAFSRSPEARALAHQARAILLGRRPRVFAAEGSPLTPGSALGLDPPPFDLPDACRRLRACAGESWIAVEPERWDPFSLRAFDAARLPLGTGVEQIVVPASVAAPESPADWRRALWAPCGTVAASVRFYEWFADLASGEPAGARGLLRRILASPGWCEYVADPTGEAPLPQAPPARSPCAPSRPRLLAVEDPGSRIEQHLQAGEKGLALSEAQRWVRSQPGRSPEAWFPLAARLYAAGVETFAPWLEAIEAEREVAGGRPGDALQRLERIARKAPSSESRRSSKLRAAEVTAMLGRTGEAARRAAAWLREHAGAGPGESVRALRLGAVGLSREGHADGALALLEEADRLGVELPPGERLETALCRARVLALAGRFEEEDRLYETLRGFALGSGEDRLAARFLAQEARALLDRRAPARALVRLEEALAVARDDPAERAELLLDLAATLYHAGQVQRCEGALAEALEAAAAAGREDLGRIARGNRVELLVNRCAWAEASAEIAALEKAARAERDDPRLLVALHHRSRLCLRRGLLSEAASDNAQARLLAERLGDRLEIGELWLEEGDRCLYEGDLEGARRAFEAAAADPPDRCDSGAVARGRLEELAWSAGPPPEAEQELESLFARDPYRAAETAARWLRLFGEAGVRPETRERAQRVLRASGGEALASRVFGSPAAAVPAEPLREIRGAVSAVLRGETPAWNGALARLGIAGLAVRDEGGRLVVRSGPEPSEPPSWQLLEAGSARLRLALWPAPAPEAAAAVGLMLETLLFRSDPAAEASDFSEGWARHGIVTADASMDEPFRRLTRFAPQAVTVLLLGESGSGKEAAARAVHRLSPRAPGPFVPVNVPAIPAALLESELFGHVRGAFTGAERDRRGLLEEASDGSIFLDEIGDLDLPLQSKLLRALQEREIRRVGENRARAIDVRVIAATSRDLAREIEAGRFREDLYYRLNVATLRLPPLRERGSDAARLARHFLGRFARDYGRAPLSLSAEAAAAIAGYAWPGNVRELENAMAQAAALCDAGASVTLEQLPETLRPARRAPAKCGSYRMRVDAHRRDLIADALDRAGGNRSRAARDLGLSRQALLYLIRELKVEAIKP